MTRPYDFAALTASLAAISAGTDDAPDFPAVDAVLWSGRVAAS